MKIDYNFKGILEEKLGISIANIDEVSGGDTAKSFRLKIESGEILFCKVLEGSDSKEMVSSEISGLSLLSNHINTPKVVNKIHLENYSVLLLEWLDFKIATNDEMKTFGKSLAKLHRQSNSFYGLEEDNYISTLRQKNKAFQDWNEFYMENRLVPHIKVLYDQGSIDRNTAKNAELFSKVIDLEIPKESPSLIHGDLWNGNYTTTQRGTYIFDPAIYYGHREMDIAMTLLFGSFGRSFYEAYQEEFPLEKGFMQRLDIHQLYPLLIHARLFGSQYMQKVVNILDKYTN